MKQFALFLALLSLCPWLSCTISSNRFALYGDIAEQQKSLGALWAMDLSAGQNLGKVSMQAEYSLYSRFHSEWDGSHDATMTADTYRASISCSLPQAELRIGLQRLNFGSAQILRPLQWFDSLDPLDPHQYTKGVDAALLRINWLNNANLWIWGIRGDPAPKGSEVIGSKEDTIEFGGRFQHPTPIGEAALSLHHRELAVGSEERAGIDLRMDYLMGLWLEASLSRFSVVRYVPKYLVSATIGSDYTIDAGNGLALMLEQMVVSSAPQGLDELSEERVMSALMASYPLGILDSLKALGTYDWSVLELSLGASWIRTYDYISLEASLRNSSTAGLSLHTMINAHF
ncbi:MAG: hypothetical protein KBB33_01940 [Candidatus Cloacimonetes bacterium]|nr:hypothetical protein [Candidatus Cloacimonadota bacterium]